jgi:polysaccharide chain length determinant protein (PEP-CTERM system associated)
MLQQLSIQLSQAEAQVASMRTRVEEYSGRVARLRSQSAEVPEIEAQLAQLNRDYQVNKDNYEKLIGRREAAKLSGDLSNTTEMMTFKIIDPPTQPLAPVGPNRTLYHSLVMLAALVAGPGAALLLSQVRPTFLSPGMMREITGLTVLGTVSMNWTAAQKIRRRREQILFGVAGGALLLAYGAMLAAALAKG